MNNNPFKKSVGFEERKPSQEVTNFHNRDDVDSGPQAHHHTLGYRQAQAAPGDDTLKRLNKLQSDLNLINLTMNNHDAQFAFCGEVRMFLGLSTSLPAGWAILDGSTFNQVAYPELYAMLGNSNVLPDLRDRFPLGASATYGLRTTGSTTIATGAGTVSYFGIHFIVRLKDGTV